MTLCSNGVYKKLNKSQQSSYSKKILQQSNIRAYSIREMFIKYTVIAAMMKPVKKRQKAGESEIMKVTIKPNKKGTVQRATLQL